MTKLLSPFATLRWAMVLFTANLLCANTIKLLRDQEVESQNRTKLEQNTKNSAENVEQLQSQVQSTVIVSVHEWEQAERKAKNAVVQVLAQYAEFNWSDPYCAPQQKQGAGSAFFINDKGYLLTNFHVVDQAKSIQICVPQLGQQALDVNIIGACPELDVALLKLTDTSLAKLKKELGVIPYLILGDSESLKPVEPVLALGYPLGQRYIKSTVGVLGGREYLNGTSYLHITAPINPGNSGGPLLNRVGEVVGINSAIIHAAQNMGYIIPINYVKIILEDLYVTKLLRRPVIGIYCNPTTEEHAQLLHNPIPTGVYINKVQEYSLASKAGVKAGDMLYKINEYSIDQFGDIIVNWSSARKVTLGEFLVCMPLESTITLEIYRNGKKKIVSFKFISPEIMPIRYIYPDFEQDALDYEIVGGMCITQLRANHFKVLPETPTLREYMRPEYWYKKALVITRILPGSYTHKIRCLSEGDILDKVNGQAVETIADLRQAFKFSKKSGYIQISTKDNVETVLAVTKLLADETRLAHDFMFNITAGIKELGNF